MPSNRTDFYDLELMYGRTGRGPLLVLRDLWEDSSLRNDERSTFQYVAESQDKLEETAKIAAHVSKGK